MHVNQSRPLLIHILHARVSRARQVRTDRMERGVRLQRRRLPVVHARAQDLPHEGGGEWRHEAPVGLAQVRKLRLRPFNTLLAVAWDAFPCGLTWPLTYLFKLCFPFYQLLIIIVRLSLCLVNITAQVLLSFETLYYFDFPFLPLIITSSLSPYLFYDLMMHRYLIGEVMYGGRAIDEFDRRVLRTYMDEYMGDFIFDDFQKFSFYKSEKGVDYCIPGADMLAIFRATF